MRYPCPSLVSFALCWARGFRQSWERGVPGIQRSRGIWGPSWQSPNNEMQMFTLESERNHDPESIKMAKGVEERWHPLWQRETGVGGIWGEKIIIITTISFLHIESDFRLCFEASAFHHYSALQVPCSHPALLLLPSGGITDQSVHVMVSSPGPTPLFTGSLLPASSHLPTCYPPWPLATTTLLSASTSSTERFFFLCFRFLT